MKGRFKREYESVISKVYSRCVLEVNLRISAYLLRISLVLVDGIRYVDLVVKKHYEVTLGTTYKVNGHLPFRKQQITPYIGIDIGHVWGPSTETQLGNTLIGGVVGVRGTVGDAVNYDCITRDAQLRNQKDLIQIPVFGRLEEVINFKCCT